MVVWIVFFMGCIGIIGVVVDKIVTNELRLKTKKIIERNIK